ncbi:dienelactone hydrolase family protein [Marinagarivorans cellulosilyticus]|uniref:Uncharacterized protein n=1 Tax=Marinagarivorans cellulosilyticus TaxID=2721545 RepID=A0AAN2BK40_9GAMM|nr:dienelactone hydrolase family protein [Marinagarivorans cellulosilyticus]BCD97590.1 hypothetical protein MARGE09_P1791 [Marinagarivorans cellulosilyticus]
MSSTTLKQLIARHWRVAALASASVGLSACVATTTPESSSSAMESSSSVVNSSSSVVSSSSSISSSSVAQSSSSLAASSSSEPEVLGEIIPRTSCPSAPPESKPVDLANVGPYDLTISKDEYVAMLEDKGVFDGTEWDLPWHMWEPAQATSSDELFPLIISLHGAWAGEPGGNESGPGSILVDGVPYMLGSSNGLLTEANQAAFPTYMIFPHCLQSEGCHWSLGHEWAANSRANFQLGDSPSRVMSSVLELVQHMVDTYQVDPARIYVTGVSMGGGGTWDMVARHPELLAAAIPLAGHTPAVDQLNVAVESKLPIWAHGGQNDFNNRFQDTVNAVNKIHNDGGCAWVAGYDGYQREDQESMKAHGHSLWQRVYLNPDLWPWLFAQKQPREGEVQTSSSQSSAGQSSSAPSAQGCDGAGYCNDFDDIEVVPDNLKKAACTNNAFAEPQFSIVQGSTGNAVKVETKQAYCSGWLAAPGVENMDKFFVKFDINVTDPKGNLRWFLLLENSASQTDTDKSMRLRLPQHAATDYLNWNIGNPESDTPKVYDGGPNGQQARDASFKYAYNQWNCMEVMVDKVGREIGLWVNGVRLDGLTIDENPSTPFDAQWPDSLRNFDITGVNIGMHEGSALIDNLVVSSVPVGCN